VTPPLGVVEGFYGKPWRFEDRAFVVETLAPAGFRFYHYAPKADVFLRARWREPFPEERAASLQRFAALCRAHGMRFGVGLSPLQIFDDFNDDARAVLGAKLDELNAIGLDDLALLFDDMKATRADLAAVQAEITHWVAARTEATRLVMCPSFYSFDPILDRVFGARPARFLEDLGGALDPKIDIYWTGPEVCSKEISPGHLDDVAEALKRKPFLWDNYPVNDGPRMSKHLHLRAFTGRPAAMGDHLSAHAVNPALQPRLSVIPALTLAASYREGARYCYQRAFREAAAQLCGAELAASLEGDLLSLQDGGLDRIAERIPRLTARYGAFDHAIAREVIGFLEGAYSTDSLEVETQ
jgi:hypothetical protein